MPEVNKPTTISQINQLPFHEKREIYLRIIPTELMDHFHLPPYLVDQQGRDLLTINCEEGSTDVEIQVRHIFDFPDPVLYAHITDTIANHLHILLYIVNDPDSPRFDIDRLPDGTSTQLGAESRNLEAELAAMQAGLAPGQIRRGLRMLKPAAKSFEIFINSLGDSIYFSEPLYYHNAILFEQLGFSYMKGRKLVEQIQAGLSPGGDLLPLLDGSNMFRQPQAANSIRLRSWAVHDGILGEKFTDVTMYKQVGKYASVNTSFGCSW